MTKKRYAKPVRAFVTNVRIWNKDNGRPLSHGKELYRCADPRRALASIEVNGKSYTRRERFAVWRAFNDGWFSFFYCDCCGFKAFYADAKVCPHCGALMFPEICKNVVEELNAEVEKMKQIRFTVYDNNTDFPVIVCGTPAECAAAMGVSQTEFTLLKWRFFNGKGSPRWFFIREVCEW